MLLIVKDTKMFAESTTFNHLVPRCFCSRIECTSKLSYYYHVHLFFIRLWAYFFPVCSKPEVYTGRRKVAPLYQFVDDSIPSFVKKIPEGGDYFSFDRQYSTFPRVLLFTTSQKISPLFRSLSREFRDKAVFAQGPSENEFFSSRFKIKDTPWLVFQGPKNGEMKDFRYRGAPEFKPLRKFIAKMLKQFKGKAPAKPSPSSDSSSVTELKPGLEAKTLKKSRWNLILFMDKPLASDSTASSLMTSLTKKHSKDPVEFFFALKSKTSKALANAFNVGEAAYCVVVFRPKNLKFVRIALSELSKKQISKLINRVIGGGQSLDKLDTLPY